MNEHTSVAVYSRDRKTGDRLRADLESLGFRSVCGSFREAGKAKSTDIVLLDITEYDREAIYFCERLLNQDRPPPETGLVALVSENTLEEIPLDYDFDDVIIVPWDLREMEYRLRRVLHRRHPDDLEDTICIGGLCISPSRYEIKVDGQAVDLSYKEYKLLKFFLTHPDRVYTREDLLENVWGDNQVSDIRTVDVHIRRVRAKINDINQSYIITVRGVGYRLSDKVV